VGINQLWDIRTQEDLKKISPDLLLELLQRAAKEVDAKDHENQSLKELNEELKQKLAWANGQLIVLTHRVFGRKSEKTSETVTQSSSSSNQVDPTPKKQKQDKKAKIQKPSERYKNATIIEQSIKMDTLPSCPCCQKTMKETALTEDAEFLHVIPRQFIIILQKRAKYACGSCYGNIVTTPAPARIKPGAGYSDELITDVTLSKYCDLIPVERYVAMAGRSGIDDIPPHSLIQGTHYLADFIKPVYEAVRREVLEATILAADETPHRMLEGHPKKSWYLWGFSSANACFFELHSTRSGDVASNLLKNSRCEVLLSDVYSGYVKAARESNIYRVSNGLAPIKTAYCNAHARRRFKELEGVFPDDTNYFVKKYEQIYAMEVEARAAPDRAFIFRSRMGPVFEEMKSKCYQLMEQYSEKSQFYKALTYYTENYAGLTLGVTDPRIPLDNNRQEGRLRNPVIGRKTWLGTHSQRGAETAAIHFTLVESCKLIHVNPREYYKALIIDLHAGGNGFTPKEWQRNYARTG
jgi:transposase